MPEKISQGKYTGAVHNRKGYLWNIVNDLVLKTLWNEMFSALRMFIFLSATTKLPMAEEPNLTEWVCSHSLVIPVQAASWTEGLQVLFNDVCCGILF